MQVYLPIAEISVNIYILLGIGAIVGFLSGLFGVGGGFLITPLLLFVGISPAIAVATGANQVVASSVSGALAHVRRKAIDFPMGIILLVGGLFGASIGIWFFAKVRAVGQVELLVQLSYVFFLGGVGLMMFMESFRALWRDRRNSAGAVRQRAHAHSWIHGLPFKMKFRTSGLYISVLPPLAVGAFVGFLAAIMGVGGGFIMVPAMIYLLGIPTKTVIGTSLFQITFVAAFTTLLHAFTTNTVDMMLALLLILGGVVGAQIGAIIGTKLRAAQLRILLSLIVLGVAARIGVSLVLEPDYLYSLSLPVLVP